MTRSYRVPAARPEATPVADEVAAAPGASPAAGRTTAPARRRVRQGAAVAAALFGIATLLAGGRVLTGASEPGYVVFAPILIFNTIMGGVYLGGSYFLWRGHEEGRGVAAGIALVQGSALGAAIISRAAGIAIANETLGALSLRTLVWVALALIAGWAAREA